MFTVSATRAWWRLLVLTTLMASLIVLSLNQDVKATTCCSTCDANLQNCFNGCHGIPSCNDRCLIFWDNCNETCVDC